MFYCFSMFVNKHFIYLGCVYLKKCYNGKPSAYYLYVKMKILVDFHICISVLLMEIFVRKLSLTLNPVPTTGYQEDFNL